MKPPPFEYLPAASVEEAVSALARCDGEAKVLAGGQSLVPMLNFRLLAPAVLVDINRIPGLDVIERTAAGLRIGALARHRAIEVSPLVHQHFPVLAAAVRHVGHLAIRNRGTIGGSLSHADPAAELPLMAVLLDARIEMAGASGARTVAARDFLVGALTTALEDHEIVTGVELSALPPATGWGFEEVARRVGDFALAAVAATVSVSGTTVEEARVAVVGGGGAPVRVAAAETLLRRQSFSREAIEAASQAAREAVDATSDLHASADYRRHLVGVLARRALDAAWRRALGEIP